MTPPVPDRVLTQHALTGAWQSHALPLTDLQYGDELNGPGALSGKLDPRLLSESPSLVDPGTTLIYVESDGELRWGGIVWHLETQGNTLSLEAAGWSSYLEHRYDLAGELGGRGPYITADRCKVLRDIWAYAQSVDDGTLGVLVDQTTSTSLVGTKEEPHSSKPWDSKSLGAQQDDLVSAEASPDYTCTVAWDFNHTQPIRRIRLGWPRLGARRDDITFSSGVNIVEDPAVQLAADEYAQVVIGIGAGDGSAKKRSINAVRNGRLRLEHATDYADTNSQPELDKRTAAERTRRQLLGSVDQITIRNTSAAPFGSWQIGDDVYTRVHNAWTDYVGWRRITGWTMQPHATGGPRAIITLAPADSYQYGGVS